MFHTVKDAKALPGFRLHVLFNSGEERIYDANPLIKEHEAFQAFLLTYKLFEQVQVDIGGYGVSWNEYLDLGCNELYYNGEKLVDHGAITAHD